MRANSFMFPYVRANARKSYESSQFMALDALASNEFQLFFLFVKWSGLTDGDYRKLVTLEQP